MHADQVRLEPLAALLRENGVQVRLEVLGQVAQLGSQLGISRSVEGVVGGACAMDVHVNDLDRADELLIAILGDPQDDRFSTEHLQRVEMPDVELCEFLVHELGQLGVEADRLYDGEVAHLLVPAEAAEVIEELLDEFCE